MQTIAPSIGKTTVSKYIKIGLDKGKKEGIEKGRHEEKTTTAELMISKGYEIKVIQELTGLTKREIEKLAK